MKFCQSSREIWLPVISFRFSGGASIRSRRNFRQARYPPEKILSPHFLLSILPPPDRAPVGQASTHRLQCMHGVSVRGSPGRISASVSTPPTLGAGAHSRVTSRPLSPYPPMPALTPASLQSTAPVSPRFGGATTPA